MTKKNYYIKLISIVLVFVLHLLIIELGLLSSWLLFVDFAPFVAVFVVPVVLNFVLISIPLKKIKSKKHVLIFTVTLKRVLIYNFIVCCFISLITFIPNIYDPTAWGPSISFFILSFLYSVVFYGLIDLYIFIKKITDEICSTNR